MKYIEIYKRKDKLSPYKWNQPVLVWGFLQDLCIHIDLRHICIKNFRVKNI